MVTFERLGLLCEQPLISDTGLRSFGGHTPRVTGSQLLAAIGIETNKVRLMARHSGDAINRYVEDAPLRSLRADLGLLSVGDDFAICVKQLFGVGCNNETNRTPRGHRCKA